MAKAFTLTAKATIPIAACLLAASLVVVARAEDKTQLTGRWNFNLDQSDDADQKIQEAQQNSKVRADTTDTGTYPGSGGALIPVAAVWVEWAAAVWVEWVEWVAAWAAAGSLPITVKRSAARIGIASGPIPNTCGSISALTRLW